MMLPYWVLCAPIFVLSLVILLSLCCYRCHHASYCTRIYYSFSPDNRPNPTTAHPLNPIYPYSANEAFAHEASAHAHEAYTHEAVAHEASAHEASAHEAVAHEAFTHEASAHTHEASAHEASAHTHEASAHEASKAKALLAHSHGTEASMSSQLTQGELSVAERLDMAVAEYRNPENVKSKRKIAREHGISPSTLRGRIGSRTLLAVDLGKSMIKSDKDYHQKRRMRW